MKNSKYPAIHAEIAELNRQIKLCDLPGKIKSEAQAKAEQEKFKAENPHIQPMCAAERESLTLESDRQQARQRRAEAEREIQHLTVAIEHLNRMLAADDTASKVQKEIDALTKLVTTAQAAVSVAQNTHAEIENLVVSETQVLDKAKAASAAAVLSQVKAGKAGTLPAVSRDRLDALTLAHESAATELLGAQEVLAECSSNLADAQQRHAEALADGAARTLHLVSREYAKALRNHKAASYKCGRPFDEPDVDMLVRQLEREAMAQAEDD